MSTASFYRIVIREQLDERWRQYFDHVTICTVYNNEQEPVTILVEHFVDQAALIGMLRYLNGLGLTLIGLEQIHEQDYLLMDTGITEEKA